MPRHWSPPPTARLDKTIQLPQPQLPKSRCAVDHPQRLQGNDWASHVQSHMEGSAPDTGLQLVRPASARRTRKGKAANCRQKWRHKSANGGSKGCWPLWAAGLEVMGSNQSFQQDIELATPGTRRRGAANIAGSRCRWSNHATERGWLRNCNR